MPGMSAGNTNATVTAASEAFSTWRNTTAKERVKREDDCETFDDMEKYFINIGHGGLGQAAEIGYGNSFIEWNTDEAMQVGGAVAASPTNIKEMLFIGQPISSFLIGSS